MNFFDTAIEYLKGVGPVKAKVLQKEFRIFNFYDLISFYPFRYVDRSKFNSISEIQEDTSWVQLKGEIIHVSEVGKQHAQRLILTFTDGKDQIDLVWFKGIRWIKEKLTNGETYIVYGKPSFFNGKLNIVHPEIESIRSDTFSISKRFVPIYSSTEKGKSVGLDSKGISRIMFHLLQQLPNNIPENLPASIKNTCFLQDRMLALKQIHFPDSLTSQQEASKRLKFEELFYIQIQLLRSKQIRIHKGKGCVFATVGHYFNTFYQSYLPFQLTNAQKKVIREIRADVCNGKQMNRLLQGDVGSGKTLVALMCMLIALDNGFQVCLMAPTEILAIQHYNTFIKFLGQMEIPIALLTGSIKGSKRKSTLELLANQKINILIGTHALIEDPVVFANLGLVVIDEQHRFGVAQRAKMWAKNELSPHILVMTATPIPRTLAMTLYGDLDISIIDQLPEGRQAIKTLHYYDNARLKLTGFIKGQIQQGRQVYVVYPLIEESEKLDLIHLQEGLEQLSREFPLPDYAISMLHGRMSSEEKEFEMQRFVRNETQIMVATTVIEVGVDVPNATTMIIENAERFGLSQLHQLRGRVGRGSAQSYCILMTGYKLSAEARKRIETMVRTQNGFEIAEVDLQLRGPGDIAGLEQSGMMRLKIADLVKDEKLIKLAREMAHRIMVTDPNFQQAENMAIMKQLQEMEAQKGSWLKIS